MQSEQQGSALQHAAQLKAAIRTDAEVVLDFATQGVYLHGATPLRPFANADDLQTDAKFSPVWARVRSLLAAAEKVS